MIEHHKMLRRFQQLVRLLRRHPAIEVILQDNQGAEFDLATAGERESLAEGTGSHERETHAVALGRDQTQRGGTAAIAQGLRHVRRGLNHGFAPATESRNYQRPLRALQGAGDDARQIHHLLGQS
jgi:hypothetical protein